MSDFRRLFVVAVLASAACASSRAGGVVESTTEQTFTVGANPTLTVRNTDGRIYVYGAEDNAITVKTYKRAFTKERLDKIAEKISLNGDAMTIDTLYPPRPEGLFADRSGTVEYTILVPQNCVVSSLELSQGEIQVQGIREASVDLRLTNGRINLKNCFAPIRLTLGNGGVDISYDWWEPAAFTLNADVTKGDVNLKVPPKSGFQLDAAAQNGHVHNQLVESEDAEDPTQLNTAVGDGGDAVFKLQTHDGNVRISKAY